MLTRDLNIDNVNQPICKTPVYVNFKLNGTGHGEELDRKYFAEFCLEVTLRQWLLFGLRDIFSVNEKLGVNSNFFDAFFAAPHFSRHVGAFFWVAVFKRKTVLNLAVDIPLVDLEVSVRLDESLFVPQIRDFPPGVV